jgi:hypothetical protein
MEQNNSSPWKSLADCYDGPYTDLVPKEPADMPLEETPLPITYPPYVRLSTAPAQTSGLRELTPYLRPHPNHSGGLDFEQACVHPAVTMHSFGTEAQGLYSPHLYYQSQQSDLQQTYAQPPAAENASDTDVEDIIRFSELQGLSGTQEPTHTQGLTEGLAEGLYSSYVDLHMTLQSEFENQSVQAVILTHQEEPASTSVGLYLTVSF